MDSPQLNHGSTDEVLFAWVSEPSKIALLFGALFSIFVLHQILKDKGKPGKIILVIFITAALSLFLVAINFPPSISIWPSKLTGRETTVDFNLSARDIDTIQLSNNNRGVRSLIVQMKDSSSSRLPMVDFHLQQAYRKAMFDFCQRNQISIFWPEDG